MHGKRPRLKPLEARKQLLLAESELNRARLLQVWNRLKNEARRLSHQTRPVGSFASLAAAAMAASSAWRHGASSPDGEQGISSRISTFMFKSCFR